MGQRCKIRTTDVRKKAHQGRHGALGHGLREETHSGKLKIKPARGQYIPVKQHPENHLAVKILKGENDRWQLRATSSGKNKKNNHATKSGSSSSHWEGRWSSSWTWTEKDPHSFKPICFVFQGVSDDPSGHQSARVKNTLAAQTAHFRTLLYTSLPTHVIIICSVAILSLRL